VIARCARFPLKAISGLRRSDQMRWENLDGDLARQPIVRIITSHGGGSRHFVNPVRPAHAEPMVGRLQVVRVAHAREETRRTPEAFHRLVAVAAIDVRSRVGLGVPPQVAGRVSTTTR
jgi:hypothetical protein